MELLRNDAGSLLLAKTRLMRRVVAVLSWRILAVLSLLLALVGIVLPGLPTVPFLLLSAWAASHGWPRLEAWLLAHTHLGPPIKRWREHGAIPRRAKYLALLMMLMSSIVLCLSDLPLWSKVVIPLVMVGVAIWMWHRPDA